MEWKGKGWVERRKRGLCWAEYCEMPKYQLVGGEAKSASGIQTIPIGLYE